MMIARSDAGATPAFPGWTPALPADGSVFVVDCHYNATPLRACSYLLLEGDRAAFVDNNTVHSVPYLLAALEERGVSPDRVEYLIVTHVHLDHSGGTAELLAHCPNATVICHPRAQRHLVDPSRLVESSRAVYGDEEFDRLFGRIDPIYERRIHAVEDDETLGWGNRMLRFLHTRGHANHHISIHDSKPNCVYTGDSFGIGRVGPGREENPLVLCSSAPANFDAEQARLSVERIIATGADSVGQTHFGFISALETAANQLLESIDRMEGVRLRALDTDLEGDSLIAFCEDRVRKEMLEQIEQSGFADPEGLDRWFQHDYRLNYLGLAIVVEKARRKGKDTPQSASA